MRIFYPNLERPKKAAQRLSARLPHVKLHLAQKAVAKALGYVDWHNLETSHAERPPTPLDQCWSTAEFQTIVLKAVADIASVTGATDGDVLYALCGARLTGDRDWELEDHVTLRLDLWRRANVFGSARRSPGSVIRMKERGRSPRICYLCKFGQPTRVLYDTGIGHCADFEAVVPRQKLCEFLPARLWQPYGVWKLRDGSEVVFSRDYFPMWRVSDLGVERLPPWLWIEGIESHRHFLGPKDWMWWDEFTRSRGLAFLAEHEIRGLPILSDALPFVFDLGVETIKDAVQALMNGTTASDPEGPWHRSHWLV